MTTMAQKKSWIEIQENLGNIHRLVINTLSKHKNGLTNLELADKLNKPINEVTGRISELKRKKLVIENGTKINKNSGKLNTVFKINREVTK